MKAKHLILIIAFVIVIDQLLKFYIKLNYFPGEEHKMIGNWFRLHFIENEGMAWGWKFGGGFGKIALTLFRLVAVIYGTFLLRDFIRKKYHAGFIVCAGLIYAGALGNLIDSLFYGLIFDTSFNTQTFENAGVVAKAFVGKHYGTFLHGKVVDMLYFPLIESTYPTWFPFVGGKSFEFFAPVFNIADASISIGVFIIFIFQNKFFKKEEVVANTVETKALANDETQVF
jgi:signal peptidase II